MKDHFCQLFFFSPFCFACPVSLLSLLYKILLLTEAHEKLYCFLGKISSLAYYANLTFFLFFGGTGITFF